MVAATPCSLPRGRLHGVGTMCCAQSNCGPERLVSSALFGWILAMFLVAVAGFSPPLTGQHVPALVELRNDILMMDREFERSSIRTNISFAGIGCTKPRALFSVTQRTSFK